MQGGAGPHDDRQARQVDTGLGLGEEVVGQLPGQIGGVEVAVFDEDRLGHAFLPHHPFLEALVAADELVQGVLMEHVLDHDPARR
ncbi:hypothetical protein D9M70_640140 [compost metagenome]